MGELDIGRQVAEGAAAAAVVEQAMRLTRAAAHEGAAALGGLGVLPGIDPVTGMPEKPRLGPMERWNGLPNLP